MENLKEEALKYHSNNPKGKIGVYPVKSYHTPHDLSLAYTPGVAEPAMRIKQNPSAAYEYTGKGNLIAVVSNGTAVLGLGNIGALASKPVMEGKAMLFKALADIDAFDIELDITDTDQFVETVKRLSPTFGGINLEDIKAPECFEIERRLKEELSLPLMHDDQHATAIVASAALLNALELAGKKVGEVRVVINGAGAAAIACARLFLALGIRKERLIMCDSKGVIHIGRDDLTPEKQEFAGEYAGLRTLADALIGADVFLGVSKAGVLTADMVRSMASHPVVFAMANPDPEITYEAAMASREDIIFAAGRSDYPNQVNNLIAFPYIFRGALDVRATTINEAMKVAAVYEIADLAKQPVPEEVKDIYEEEGLVFGRNYLLPKPLDGRLLYTVSVAVARAAVESGVATKPVEDWNVYRKELESRGSFISALEKIVK